MATWKKVIVSGSSANLANLQVDSLSSGLVTGASGNLTTTAINGTGNIVATTAATGLSHSGSFSGSFEGDGSNLTGVTAQASNALTEGTSIESFSYNGSSAGVTVGVADAGITETQLNTSVAGTGIAGGGGTALSINLTELVDTAIDVAADSFAFIDANDSNLTKKDSIVDLVAGISGNGIVATSGVQAVDPDGSTITVGTNGIKVTDGGIGTTQIADSLGTIGTNSFTGSFSGSFTGDVDINLKDLTAGNGLSGTAYDGNIAREFTVQADTTTGGNTKPVSVGANGVGFDISTIDGGGIIVSSEKLAVNVDDSTIALGGAGTDFVQVKDGGIDTTQLADDSVTTAKIDASLGTLAGHSFTGSFSGSFTGDGTGLTGLATTLTVDGDSTTQDVNLTTDDLQILGTTNEIETAVTKVSNDVKLQIGLPDDVTIGNDLTVTRDATIGRDVVITRNLTVQGTASFQHSEDLDVKDRFIRLASGSNSAGDGGIVVQQTGPTDGEVFGFDAIKLRWGVSGSFDASQNAFSPDSFMAQVLEGAGNVPSEAAARYVKKGNIFVGANEDIYIYS
tara:strand:- start:1086 stop:2783 length:1698 start_codon:yes stop_codon:yes gene_type:complete